ALAATDPQAALDLAVASASNNQQWGNGGTYGVFSAWANKDPAEAAAKAAELPASQQRSQAFQAIAATWASQDPQAAIAWANGLPSGQDKRNAINSVVSAWTQQDSAG